MSGFDTGYSTMADAFNKSQQIKEQQRIESQNTVGAQLLDSINNASNIKPTTKDPNGNDIPNPAYAQAQKDKQDLITQYMGLNSPQQHATFAQRIHGLIFGNPAQGEQQPALSPNSAPVKPVADPNAPAAATPPPSDPNAPGGGVPHPLAPAPADHPLNAITNGIKTLGSHLAAFANPNPPTPPSAPDPTAIARQYKDPGQVAFERNEELYGLKGENAIKVAEIRKDALMASLQARPPHLLSQTTIPDLLDQIKVDPTTAIYGPDGQEISPTQLASLPAGTIAREFRAGSQIFYALGDQNSKTLKVGNEVYDIPAVGAITAQNSTGLGVANPGTTSTHTDPFGLTDTTRRSPALAGMAGATAPTSTPPPAGQPRPISSAAPVMPTSTGAPTVQPVNPGARAPGTVPAGGAVKARPISSQAPVLPPSQLPPLDTDGHIPAGVGNDLVRQYANNILDGQDSKDIPNPRARAAAEAMASAYGWGRGVFTPQQKVQFKVATDFLQQLKDSPSLSVLDSYLSREKIARAMKDPKQMDMMDRIAAYNLTPKEADFVRLVNAARGTVAGLSTITRSGRATNNQVTTIATELPNVFQSSSSTDAKARIDQLLKEANIALQTNPMTVGKKGPVSSKAPSAPGTWKAPADAPPAPSIDGKVLKADGKVIAKSQGGQWVQP